jgi:hypothetical protein
MPKLAKVGTFRKAAAEAAVKETAKEAGDELSRGQRKRLQKREQYLQKEKMILSSLKLKRQEEQKKQIDGMDAIRSALLDTVVDKEDEAPASTSTAPIIKSNKAKQNLVQKEVAHMNLVLQHPAFQADPFATIREHLQNTMAQTASQRQKETARQLKERNEKKEQKKALKKENTPVKKKRTKKFKATRSKSRK